MADHIPNALEKLRAALGTDTGPRLTPGEVQALLADYDDLTDAMREAAVLLGVDPGPHERTARVLWALHELRDPAHTEPCAYCARPVDTREKSEGGDGWGSQLTDGRWACSAGCWEMLAIEGGDTKEISDGT